MSNLNIYNANIILSNKFTSLCMPYPYKDMTDKEIELQMALDMCNKLIFKTPEGLINKICLFGCSDNNIWRTKVIHLVQYINQLNRTQLSIQIENDFLKEEHLKFCKENNLFLKLIYNKNIAIDFLNLVFSYKPLTKVIYQINKETYKDFYNNYLKIEALNCQNFDVDFDYFYEWTDEELASIKEQFNKIKDHIYTQFTANEIPLVPEKFKKLCNKILILDRAEKDNISNSIFDFVNCLNLQCGFSNDSTFWIDQSGNVYTCCITDFNTESKFYCGQFNKENQIFEQVHDNFDLFTGIYVDLLDIARKTADKDLHCLDCSRNLICTGNCYSINTVTNGNGGISSGIYCNLITYVTDLTINLIKHLDEDKNELFRDFLYGCSFKGYFLNDR